MNFYREAASILDRIGEKKGSVKSCLSAVDEKNRKRTAALVIETLKYKSPLTSTIEDSGLLKYEKRILTPNLALVLVHDLLLSKGIQASDGPLKQAISRHKTRLQAEWVKLKVKKGVKANQELAQEQDVRADAIPRYVRVNTNMWSVGQAVEALGSQGFVQVDVQTPADKQFAMDAHIPDLLVFHHTTSFQSDPNYTSGKLILQDKASCFPSTVLAPPPSGVVIDATSAPGNKTSHISALMGNSGKIFAFERDRKRFAILKSMLARAGCRNTLPIHADFLATDPLDPQYDKVTHILLDPSCSGSGIVNRLDYLVENDAEDGAIQEERLQKLASFQLTMIKHAMKFPSVQKIVYSTCSIHAQENEGVVREALGSTEAIGNFKLAPRELVLPTWNRRGVAEELQREGADGLVRCVPGEDATNGFFVSCFIRISSPLDTHTAPSSFAVKGRRRKRPEGQTDDDPSDRDPTAPEAAEADHASKKKRRKKRKRSRLSTEAVTQ